MPESRAADIGVRARAPNNVNATVNNPPWAVPSNNAHNNANCGTNIVPTSTTITVETATATVDPTTSRLINQPATSEPTMPDA